MSWVDWAKFAPKRSEFGRFLTVEGPIASKQTELRLIGDGDQIRINVVICNVGSASDDRHIVKYLAKARDRAVKEFKKGSFENVRGDIGRSRLTISGDWILSKHVSFQEIKNISKAIYNTMYEMNLTKS